MIKVGDRVRNIRVEVYKDEPIVVIDKSYQISKCLYGSEYKCVILG